MVASAGAPSGGRVPVEVVEILVLEAKSRRGCFIVHCNTLFPCVFQSYVIPNMSVWILSPSPNLGVDTSYKNKKGDPYWKSQKQTEVRPTIHGFWRLQTVQWLPRTFIAFLGPSSLKMSNNLEVLSFNSNSSPPHPGPSETHGGIMACERWVLSKRGAPPSWGQPSWESSTALQRPVTGGTLTYYMDTSTWQVACGRIQIFHWMWGFGGLSICMHLNTS